MPSSFFVNGTDLDSIFAPIQTGMTPAAATGFTVSGVDLNARYAPLAYGSAAGVTNYKVNGTDLNAIFAAFGSTNIVVLVGPSNVSGSAAAGAPSGTVTSSAPMTVSVSGGHPPYTYTWTVSGGAAANSPSSPTTYISATVNANSTLAGSAFCTIRDSTGRSVNTNTASYSLINTSQNEVSFSFVAKFSTADDATAYRSQTFYGTGPSTDSATPEPVEIPGGGQQMVALGWQGTPSPNGSVYVIIYALNGVELTQSFLASLTVAGYTFIGASATFSHEPNPNYSIWTWPAPTQILIAGNTYSGDFIYNP
jgi:hypothetical protein